MAAPMTSAEDGKLFKFQLKVDGKELYLTSTGASTTNKAQGVDCSITSGAIACGPNKGGLGSSMHNKLAPSTMATNNKGWKIGADNEITYKPNGGKGFHIATKKMTNEIWAENCEADFAGINHPDAKQFTQGKAYAVFE
jgi:hypothetical protein